MGKSRGIINAAYVHQSVFHQNVKSTASLHMCLWPKGPIPFDIFLSHSSLSVLTMMCLDLCITHVPVTHWPHPIWDFPVPFFIVCVNYDVLICASQMVTHWPHPIWDFPVRFFIVCVDHDVSWFVHQIACILWVSTVVYVTVLDCTSVPFLLNSVFCQ